MATGRSAGPGSSAREAGRRVTNPLPFIVSGLVAGSAFGLAATGLVLSYRISRILNFAHGAIGMFCAFSYWQASDVWGWPSPLALVVMVVLLPTVLALLSEAIVFRHLTGASVFARTAATIGLLLAFFGTGLYLWSNEPVDVASPFPTIYLELPGVVVSGQQIGIVACVAVITAGLFAFLRYSRLGIELRAVVDNPSLAQLSRIDSRRTTQLAWITSYALAAVSGLLLAPLFSSNSLQLTLVVVYALVAAVIGGMRSLPLALGGALALAIADALALGYLPSGETTSQARGILPFAFLFVAVILQARRFEGEDDQSSRTALLSDLGRITAVTRREPSWQGALALLTGCLLVWAVFGDYWTFIVASGVAYGTIFLSYSSFTSMTGLVSLASGAFAGVGAITAGKLINEAGWPWMLALGAAAVVGALSGALVALPTVRLRGIFIALATVAFAQLVESVVFNRTSLSGGVGGIDYRRPAGFSSDLVYLLLLVVVFLGLGAATDRIRRSWIGRELQANLASPIGARSVGIRADRGRLVAFVLSASIAAVGGTLHAGVVRSASVNNWFIINAFTWLAVTAIGGIGSIWGALAAGLVFAVMPEIISNVPVLSSLYIVIFGFGSLLALRRAGGLVNIGRGLSGAWRRAGIGPRGLRTEPPLAQPNGSRLRPLTTFHAGDGARAVTEPEVGAAARVTGRVAAAATGGRLRAAPLRAQPDRADG